jgi:hypothetical protein
MRSETGLNRILGSKLEDTDPAPDPTILEL